MVGLFTTERRFRHLRRYSSRDHDESVQGAVPVIHGGTAFSVLTGPVTISDGRHLRPIGRFAFLLLLSNTSGKSVSHRVLDSCTAGWRRSIEEAMATITKKELIDRIADNSNQKRVQVKKVVQLFLDEIVSELGKGNRLEFRDFGVFETKLRKARRAQNPKTLEPVAVPEKRTVKFKVGRLMKQRLGDLTGSAIDDEAGDINEMDETSEADEEGEEPGHASTATPPPTGA